MKKHAPLLIGALVVGALLTACGGDDASSKSELPATTSTTDATTDTSTADTACAQADPNELEAAVAIDVPAGYVEQPDDVGDTGPSDLAKAASDDGSEDAGAHLTDLGFRRGYQRLWIDESDSELIAFLFEFSDTSGAATYLDESAEGVGTDLAEFPVAGVDDAVGISGTTEGVSGAAVMAVHGPYLVQLIANADEGVASLDQLQAIASQATASLLTRAGSPS